MSEEFKVLTPDTIIWPPTLLEYYDGELTGADWNDLIACVEVLIVKVDRLEREKFNGGDE